MRQQFIVTTTTFLMVKGVMRVIQRTTIKFRFMKMIMLSPFLTSTKTTTDLLAEDTPYLNNKPVSLYKVRNKIELCFGYFLQTNEQDFIYINY